ncbi:MAG: thiolase domain-containing protein, partial [Anaerolineae bacterium]|nr:thiolase domain-containing protein [Anaerolineae bacterium]
MRDVAIIGIGQTPVGEHWELGLRQLALDALHAVLRDAGIEQIDALIVANALGGNLSGQNHLGALVADYAGMPGVEALRVEAADASGGLALRQGCLMIASGVAEAVLVLGVEKATDRTGSERDTAL